MWTVFEGIMVKNTYCKNEEITMQTYATTKIWFHSYHHKSINYQIFDKMCIWGHFKSGILKKCYVLNSPPISLQDQKFKNGARYNDRSSMKNKSVKKKNCKNVYIVPRIVVHRTGLFGVGGPPLIPRGWKNSLELFSDLLNIHKNVMNIGKTIL